MLALLGRNGAGKTTCMNAVIGFLPPRQGEIRLFGERIGRLSPEAIARKGVGLVPQGRRVFPTLTVKENLLVAARSKRLRLESERASSCFRGSRNEPSSMPARSRAASSRCSPSRRALMGNPRVLLMDEPSEGLAPLIVAEVGRIIARLKAEGQSILLVEQNVKLAFDLADDVAILNTGRVAFAGPAAAARDNESLITQHLGVF